MRILLIFVVAAMLYPSFKALSTPILKESWRQGKIQLKDGHTLSGKISYRLKHNLLMYKAEGKIKTFTPRLVDYFEIHDKNLKCIKRYHAIPVRVHENKMTSQFFQVVITGGITLLKREALIRKRVGKKTVVKKVDQFYCLEVSRFVKPLVPSKKNVLKLMNAHADKVRNFIKDQDLKPYKADHLAALFIYYNHLNDSPGEAEGNTTLHLLPKTTSENY